MTMEEKAALEWLGDITPENGWGQVPVMHAALILKALRAPMMVGDHLSGMIEGIGDCGSEIRQPTADEIVVWFNSWLKESITYRERILINEVVSHALKYPEDVFRANREKRWSGS